MLKIFEGNRTLKKHSGRWKVKATGIIVPGMTLSAIVMKYRLRAEKKKNF